MGTNKSSNKVCAIVVAAGHSQRMNGVDKIMALLGGKPVLEWSIEALQKSDKVDRIVLVNSQKNEEPVQCLVVDHKWNQGSGRLHRRQAASGLGGCRVKASKRLRMGHYP